MLIKQPQQDRELTLEMTPLIDVVFLLLIFFLVATTFHQSEREMNIALPAAQAGGPISVALKEIIINVDADGVPHVGGKVIELESLQDLIGARLAVNPEQKVSVRGDKSAAYAYIVRVLDVCKTAGISEPYLDTVVRE
jgi:biopolymer transport protein ExbD